MAANEKYQTSKQYKEREKRISKKADFDNEINTLYNDIVDIDTQIKELNTLKEEKQNKIQNIKDNRFTDVLTLYNDENLMKSIIENARKTTFSASNINDIENKCQKGINEDNFTLDDIEIIFQMEKKINKEIPHTNFISDMICALGNIVDIAFGKGEKDNHGN